MRLYWQSGWLLVLIGVIHNALGLVLGWAVLGDMAAAGWWNSVEPGGQMDYARSALLWFLLLGCFWWMLGVLMQGWLQRGHALPPWLGWSFVACGAGVAFLLPASGAWFFLLLGALLIRGPGVTAPACDAA